MNTRYSAVFLSLLLASTTVALPTKQLLQTVITNGNGLLNVVNPALDDVGLLTGGCQRRGLFSKVTSLLNLPAAVDPVAAIELVLLVVKLERTLNKLTCTLDTVLPLDVVNGLVDEVDDLLTEVGGSALEAVDDVAGGVEDALGGLLVQLGDLLKDPNGVGNLVAYAQSLIVKVEALLAQLLAKAKVPQ
ncbi:hypothetical protein M3Y99_01970400 [Aphelenchoides fujianensis]|nr:hypothetical protein M3Y99_01970400 [Aphelenchoides fujianensis]